MGWLDFPIHVTSERCLAVQSPRSTCRRCEQVCPVGAIHLEERRVELAEDACLGCGLCLTHCPTGVLAYAAFSWPGWLARAASQSHEETLDLGCAYAATSADVTLPCLGLLNDDLLLALAAQGIAALTLHTADCAACPLGAENLVRESLDRAEVRCPGALGVAWQDTLPRQTPNLWAAWQALAHPLDQAVGRRGFLALLGRQAREALAEPSQLQSPGPSEALPPTRLALLQTLGEADEVAFPCYTIDPTCDDCQDAEALCALFCPSGALQRLEVEGGVGFVFQSHLCLGCDQCVVVCPRKAIQKLEPAVERAPRVLCTFRTTACHRCGQQVTGAGDDLCANCRRQMKLDEMLAQLAH